MTGGLAYEGLSDAGQSGEPMVIVLNDNGMSINKNVGGMATLLSKQRVKPSYLHFKQFYRNTVGKARGLYKVLHHVKEHVKDLVLPNNCSTIWAFTTSVRWTGTMSSAGKDATLGA